jgi:hypothetical protein
MHTANLRQESQNLSAISDLCNLLEAMVQTPQEPSYSPGDPS